MTVFSFGAALVTPPLTLGRDAFLFRPGCAMQELIPAEPGVQETFCKRWQKATASNDYFQILWRGGGGGSAILRVV